AHLFELVPHDVPSARAVCVTAPVFGSQKSVVHALPSSTAGAATGMHAKDADVEALPVAGWQNDPAEHRSLVAPHGVPTSRGKCKTPALESHASSVHGSPSSITG